MAWTVTKTNMILGNKRAMLLDVSVDAATQTVETGLSYIEGVAIGAKSLSTGGVKVYANSNASGVQSLGVLGCSGFVSGDDLFVLVYGRS